MTTGSGYFDSVVFSLYGVWDCKGWSPALQAGKTDGFDSHKVHQWYIKCVITLAAGYLVASLKSPINRALTQLVSVTDS